MNTLPPAQEIKALIEPCGFIVSTLHPTVSGQPYSLSQRFKATRAVLRTDRTQTSARNNPILLAMLVGE